MSIDEQKELRKQQAFDFCGGIAHTTFGVDKTFLYNLTNPELNKMKQVYRRENDQAIYKAKNNDLKSMPNAPLAPPPKVTSQSQYKDQFSVVREEAIRKKSMAKRASTPDVELPTTTSIKVS